MKFSHFFINKPIFASVISIIITLVGFISYFNLPVTQYPNITPTTIVVYGTYAGASPEVIMNTTVAPIEQQLNGVEGMEYMYYIFEPEVISIIVKGWWFKFDEHKVTCKVYDGDMFIGEINNLNEEQVLNIRRFCEFKKRRCDF